MAIIERFNPKLKKRLTWQLHLGAQGQPAVALETHDERIILPNTCFSVEPGIYLPPNFASGGYRQFGVRSEIDMMIRNGKAEVTGRIQNDLVLI